jgi:hypothetical protein
MKKVSASGFTREQQAELEAYMDEIRDEDEENVAPEDESDDEVVDDAGKDEMVHLEEEESHFKVPESLKDWLDITKDPLQNSLAPPLSPSALDGTSILRPLEEALEEALEEEEEEGDENVDELRALAEKLKIEAKSSLMTIEEEQTTSESDSEGDDLIEINNKQYKAFRKVVIDEATTPPLTPKENRTRSLSAEEIRKKVASGFRKRAAPSHKTKNQMKTKETRNINDNINNAHMWG